METPPVDPHDPRRNIPPIELDPADEIEIEIDLAELDQLRHDTIPEGCEYLGEYPSVEAYFRGQLEDLIEPSIAGWLLDCIDYGLVAREHEAGGWRYLCEQGQVYRLGIPTPPDPRGPVWMGRA